MSWPFNRRNMTGLALIADELKLERDVLKAEQVHLIETLQSATRELENQRKENMKLVRENAILKARLAIEDPPEKPKTGPGMFTQGQMSPPVVSRKVMEYIEKSLLDHTKLPDGFLEALAKAESGGGPKGPAYPVPGTPGDTIKIGRLPKLGGDDGT